MIPAEIQEIFASDVRIVRVFEYLDGFVPMAYKWRAPGTRHVWIRGRAEPIAESYDRKRAHGRGPRAVGFSAKGGRLTSR